MSRLGPRRAAAPGTPRGERWRGVGARAAGSGGAARRELHRFESALPRLLRAHSQPLGSPVGLPPPPPPRPRRERSRTRLQRTKAESGGILKTNTAPLRNRVCPAELQCVLRRAWPEVWHSSSRAAAFLTVPSPTGTCTKLHTHTHTGAALPSVSSFGSAALRRNGEGADCQQGVRQPESQ